MAHYVKFSIPPRRLGKTDIEFEAWDDNEKIGILLISKVALVWKPGGNKTNGYKMSWWRLNDLMAESGSKIKFSKK